VGIDNGPVAVCRERIARLIPSATPQALARVVNGQSLRGPKDSAAHLRVRDARGREREAMIGRTEPWRSIAHPPGRSTPAVWVVLPSGYGYDILDRIKFSEVTKAK